MCIYHIYLMTSTSILSDTPHALNRRAADVVCGVCALFQPRRRLSLDLLCRLVNRYTNWICVYIYIYIYELDIGASNT